MPLSMLLLYNKNDKPLAVYTFDGTHKQYNIYKYGVDMSAYDMLQNKQTVKELISSTVTNGDYVILSNFKEYVSIFNLELCREKYDVYDLHLPKLYTSGDDDKDNMLCRSLCAKLFSQQTHEYQKVLANAAVVYQSLENKGLTSCYVPVYPQWHLDTYSGRSRNTGFNAQGATKESMISCMNTNDNIALLHFDWVSADIRSAAILSGDEELQKSFYESDPYTFTMNKLNCACNRSEAKTFLLKSINSLNYDAISSLYPSLSNWIKTNKDNLNNGGSISTVLGRKFKISNDRNILSAFNGAMQGSTAHAMHRVVRSIWEQLGYYLLLETHDAIIMACNNRKDEIRDIIKIVIDIMTRPFKGIMDNDPFFPVKVSKGEQWLQWKMIGTFREWGIDSNKK